MVLILEASDISFYKDFFRLKKANLYAAIYGVLHKSHLSN